jgi:hypothetical protein
MNDQNILVNIKRKLVKSIKLLLFIILKSKFFNIFSIELINNSR